MGAFLGVLVGIIYIGITIFMISLALRLVRAVEKMSTDVGKIAENIDNK